jgi:hypothetical protein
LLLPLTPAALLLAGVSGSVADFCLSCTGSDTWSAQGPCSAATTPPEESNSFEPLNTHLLLYVFQLGLYLPGQLFLLIGLFPTACTHEVELIEPATYVQPESLQQQKAREWNTSVVATLVL